MKQKFTLVITGTCIVLSAILMQSFVSASVKTAGEDPKEKERKEGKMNVAAKSAASRNNSSVKIYPDIFKRVMHVVAKDDNDGQGLDFFVFDLEGTLMQHYKMKSGDHQKITGLHRGKYVFRVFAGDEETATGNFDIR
ncbi:MAG: hypothetical protein H7Y42_16195 [Chitinophagaceae bacterium]|nr:hypothetical protein [Chitinophagaceae bacterium]